MALDQVENFVRVSVDGIHDSGASTVALESGEASELPPVSNGKYNLIWFNSSGFAQPDEDPNVEIVRVNSINTSDDTISVQRGMENTSATAKSTGTQYELALAPTAKIIQDIDANKLDKTQRYTDDDAVFAVNSSGFFVKTSDPIDADKLGGVEPSGFIQSGGSIDADTLNGINASEFIQSGASIDADTLDGKDSSDFVEASDTVDADTLDGKDSTNFVETGDTIDADTINGFEIQKNGSDGNGIINFKT
jgi:hypothetical protein